MKRVLIIPVFLLTFILFSCNNSSERPNTSDALLTPAPPVESDITEAPKEESSLAETTEPEQSNLLPQIDSSTARIPITDAIYQLFTGKYGYTGPAPLASKTHGAWINLADGKADIVFLVAPTNDELSYFAQKNVDIETKIYGYDGLVFMGNELNPVQNLTDGQIRSIYNGSIKNWQEVGGIDAPINAYVRNPESGSQRLFESLVWEGHNLPDFSNFALEEIQEMGEVLHMVLFDPHGLGFSIMSYIDSDFRDMPQLFSVNGYLPTTENFASGNYPFLMTSYVAIRADEPIGSPARLLFDWIGSGESHEIISANSTLTVAFSDPVCIRFAVAAPEDNANLSNMIAILDKQIIQRNELFQFTLEEIGYLRNGVFALSGKSFKTDKYSQYFNAQSWYKETNKADDDIFKSFNDIQNKNLETILSYEKELERVLVNQK